MLALCLALDKLSDQGMLQRIHIFGAPGSGKSYAARHLSHRLEIPAYDLDELFWDPAAPCYGVPASQASRDARLMSITEQAAWIVEGVYYRWLRPSFERADMICVLRPNVYLRDWRVVKRFVTRKLGTTPTKREGILDLYRLIGWNHKHDTDNLQRVMNSVQEFNYKTVACRSADDLLDLVCNKHPSKCGGKVSMRKKLKDSDQ